MNNNDDLIIVDEEEEVVNKPESVQNNYNTDDLIIVEEEADVVEETSIPIVEEKKEEEKKSNPNEKILNPIKQKEENKIDPDEAISKVIQKKPVEKPKDVKPVKDFNSNKRGAYDPTLDESVTTTTNSQGINKYVWVKYGKMAYWLCLPVILMVIIQSLFNQFLPDVMINDFNMRDIIISSLYIPIFIFSLIQVIYSKRFITHNPLAFIISLINLIIALAGAVVGFIGIDIIVEYLLIIVYSTAIFFVITSSVIMLTNKKVFDLIYTPGIDLIELVAFEIDEAYGKEDRITFERKVRTLSYNKEFTDLHTYIDNTHRRYLSRRNYMLPLGHADQAIDQIVAAVKRYEGKAKAKATRKILVKSYKSRDYAEINNYRSEYLTRYEAYISNIKTGYGEIEEIVLNDGKGTFTGNHIKLVVMRLVSLLVSVITATLAGPAMFCWIERWRCKNTFYQGKKLSFDGRASSLLGKWLCWLFLSVVTAGLFALVIPSKMKKWKAENTHLTSEYKEFGGTYDGTTFKMIIGMFRTIILSVASLGLLIPYAICLNNKYRFKHTIYDGKRLGFKGRGLDLLAQGIKWVLFSIFSLGIFTFYIPGKMKKWIASNVTVSVCIENVKAK